LIHARYFNIPSYFELRRELRELVLRDLFGPAGGEEEALDEPYIRDRHILGLLAPKGQSALPDDNEDRPVRGQADCAAVR